VLVLSPPIARPSDPRAPQTLPAGSYRITLASGDGLAVAMPVLLRGGDDVVLRPTLPCAADVPPGFVFVHAGRFLHGSSDDERFREQFLRAAPMHERETAAYLIARDETTYAAWMAYLRALPPAERAQRRPLVQGGAVRTLRLDGDDPFTLVLQPTDLAFVAAEGAPLIYAGRHRRQQVRWEQLPVSGVSYADARAYAAWLAATGRVPRARLCTELEWERAARGADGRSFPHGERLAPDDANFDLTYGQEEHGFGPDEVGSHPASDSPFGVRDLAGNVKEWVEGMDGKPRLRGGGYYQDSSVSLTMNRDAAEPTMRQLWLGIRLCADPP